jgi:transcriptional regulator with XRE-family HTH domain
MDQMDETGQATDPAPTAVTAQARRGRRRAGQPPFNDPDPDDSILGMPGNARDAAPQTQQDTIKIGARLRSARMARELTLEEVAKRAGVSKGFLSQLERDATAASVATLNRICGALEIRLGSLFEETQAYVVRAGERRQVSFGGKGVSDYVLSSMHDRRLAVVESHLEPQATYGDELYVSESQIVFACLLKGSAELLFEQSRIRLSAGDAVQFAGGEPHTWRNPSSRRGAVILFVNIPSDL